jgi:hypothetical protein
MVKCEPGVDLKSKFAPVVDEQIGVAGYSCGIIMEARSAKRKKADVRGESSAKLSMSMSTEAVAF